MNEIKQPHFCDTDTAKKENFVFEIFKIVLIALIIVAPIRLFIAQPFVVSGASMNPTFKDSQYLIVDQLSYEFGEPQRGDVIVFRFPLEPSKFFIKRIIGLPNETIDIQNQTVTIITKENPEGFVLDEPYLVPGNMRSDFLKTTLSSEEYFVMGDNRKESSDSRSWGTLGREYIIGRALIRLFPITQFSILPGQIK